MSEYHGRYLFCWYGVGIYMAVGVGGVGVGLVFVLTFAPWSVFTLIPTSRRRSCIAFTSGQRYVPGGGSSGNCRTQRMGRPQLTPFASGDVGINSTVTLSGLESLLFITISFDDK